MIIKCPECQKEVSDSAQTCPACGFSISKLTTSKNELEKKQGCGGCLFLLGILIFIAGLGTFISARKSADDLVQTTYQSEGADRLTYDESLAKAAGHGSYSDFLSDQNKESGLIFVCVGIGMGIFGYQLSKEKKPKN